MKVLDDLNLIDGLDNLTGSIIKRIIFGSPRHSECELLLDKSLDKINEEEMRSKLGKCPRREFCTYK